MGFARSYAVTVTGVQAEARPVVASSYLSRRRAREDAWTTDQKSRRHAREGGVGDFGLLQTEDGRVVFSKPSQDALLAGEDRVDIPGCDPYPSLHRRLPPQRV